jgi:predicted nucleotidyltransferase
MRLTEGEIKTLLKEVQTMDPKAEVWLYGSRTNEKLQGGDIDLLIISSIINFTRKIDLLVQLKIALGDQKIDLHITQPEEKLTDPLTVAILKNAIQMR